MKQELIKPENRTIKTDEETGLFDPKYRLWLGFVLLISLLVMSPVFNNDFTNWDDGGYVTDNNLVHTLSFQNIKAYFSGYFVSNYQPLTMLSLAIDYRISGPDPWMFHLSSLILHLIIIVLVYKLVFLLFRKFDIALIAAGLFGIHTLHVETVAWISDRKDLLCTLFFLASVISYIKYRNKPRIHVYLLSLLFFVLSLLSKATAVTLPVTLIACDYLLGYKPFSLKSLAGKVPYLMLAVAAGVVAVYAQRSTSSISGIAEFTLQERVLFACYGFTGYIAKLIMPVNLSAIYPFPVKINGSIPQSFWYYLLPVIAVIAGFIIALKKSKVIAFAIMFFAINIILLLQLIPVGSAIMADRYAYLPSVGFFIIIASTYHYLAARNRNNRIWMITVLSVYCVILSVMSVNRTKVWKDGMTLWSDVLAKNDKITIAWIDRGNIKFGKGDYQGAISDYNGAIMLKSDQPEAWANRGTSKKELGDLKGAVIDYDKAIAIDPKFDKAYYNRGGAKMELTQFEDAIADYNETILINPKYAEAYSNRGNARIDLANGSKNMQLVYGALADYNKAIELKPDYVEAYSNRGIAKSLLGDFDGAIDDYSRTIRLDANDGLAYFLRGMAKIEQKGLKEEGCADLFLAYNHGFNQAAEQIQRLCKK